MDFLARSSHTPAVFFRLLPVEGSLTSRPCAFSTGGGIMRRVALILAFIVALTSFACSGDSVTTPPPTQVPVSSVTVAGTVWVHDTGGVKPYANVQMHAFVETGHSGHDTAPISSGPDGRYSFTVPTGALVRVSSISAAYQPCVTAIAATG